MQLRVRTERTYARTRVPGSDQVIEALSNPRRLEIPGRRLPYSRLEADGALHEVRGIARSQEVGDHQSATLTDEARPRQTCRKVPLVMREHQLQNLSRSSPD